MANTKWAKYVEKNPFIIYNIYDYMYKGML